MLKFTEQTKQQENLCSKSWILKCNISAEYTNLEQMNDIKEFYFIFHYLWEKGWHSLYSSKKTEL